MVMRVDLSQVYSQVTLKYAIRLSLGQRAKLTPFARVFSVAAVRPGKSHFVLLAVSFLRC